MSHTCDIQVVFQALHVQGALLLDEVQELDGVGHPEKDVLQVWDQARQGEARRGDGLLATGTEGLRVTPGPSLHTGTSVSLGREQNYDLSSCQGQAGKLDPDT